MKPSETNIAGQPIKGTVQKITYRNDQNGYTVASVRAGRENITVVGVMPTLFEGESAVFKGDYTVHPTYGKQFSVSEYERKTPETVSAVLKYLSSGAIKGVGQSTAIKIVEKFGKESLNIIENSPQELAQIHGISLNKAIQIGEEFKRQSGLNEITLLLSPYGVSPERCVKVYKAIGVNCVKEIRDNPYILLKHDLDFSFESAEKMAFDFGIPADNEQRLCAGIGYILKSNLQNGHTALPKAKVLAVAAKLLESDYYRLDAVTAKMTASFDLSVKLIGDEEFLSLPEYYAAEEYIAARIRAGSSLQYADTVDELEIDYVENKLGIKFESKQREAIHLAFTNNIMILTGGPGTGKTTALNGIIELLERREANVILTAPTGRAAKRMTELTGREAKTIHRLLEAEWVDGNKTKFARNERNPLPCDVIIVDEASMLDTMLFESLMRSVKLSCRMILVGDSDQLPSISAGNVLSDLISSGKVPCVSLTEIFRQSNESLIVRNAHLIINDERPDLSDKSGDFFFLGRGSSSAVLDTVIDLCQNRLPESYGFDPKRDIQVICPSRKFETGCLNVNNLLQRFLNPNAGKGAHLSYKGVYFFKGDKVMQIKNNYDLSWEKQNGETGFGVFNGDVGFIADLNAVTGSMRVLYEDRVVTYTKDTLSEIELAYAITAHKSQGSEFDCVVMPVFAVPPKLAYRNLLYTAITRAKKIFIAVGDAGQFYKMCDNNKKTLRYTLLKEFLGDR